MPARFGRGGRVRLHRRRRRDHLVLEPSPKDLGVRPRSVRSWPSSSSSLRTGPGSGSSYLRPRHSMVSAAIFFAAEHGLVDATLIASLVTLLPGAALTTATVEARLRRDDRRREPARLQRPPALAARVRHRRRSGARGLPGERRRSTTRRPTCSAGGRRGSASRSSASACSFTSRRRAGRCRGCSPSCTPGGSARSSATSSSAARSSGFVGALAMTPVAYVVATRPTGPPATVTFLPAFWLLVPGALGLIGVTEIATENDVRGAGLRPGDRHDHLDRAGRPLRRHAHRNAIGVPQRFLRRLARRSGTTCRSRVSLKRRPPSAVTVTMSSIRIPNRSGR